jgi:MtrB/PioB family decaheme-associated outer membrane protein
LLAGGITVAAPAAWAQRTTLTGAAQAGGRGFITQPADSEKARFEQYRDMTEGVLIESIFLRAERDSFTSLQLIGRNIGLRDQNLSLRGNDPGRADVQLRWDRITHLFSTNARFLGTELTPGVFVLPAPRPDTATLNASAYVGPIRERWDPVKATITVTPSRRWDFKAEYQFVDKQGRRPMGMAFGSPGTNAREINEPIDQTMNDIRLSQAYTRPRFQAMVSYAYSRFSNALESVISDNPRVTVDSLRGGTSRGRTALAPDNHAQTLTGTVAVSLPRHTRVTGTLSYGWRNQNAPFIPATINPLNQDSLTRAGYVFPTSLNGNIHTSLVNVTLASRPARPVSVSARFRSFDYNDKTPEIGVPIMVINDRTFAAGAESERFPYTRHNADASVSVRPLPPLALTAGYGWERMDRDTAVRNVDRVTENSGRFSLDYTAFAWASARLSYLYGRRRANEYHQVDASENPDSRRFDEADRNRHSWNLMLTVSPIDQVSLTGTWQRGRDTFPSSPYGVQRDNSNAIGAELEVTPIPRLSLGVGYQREWYDNGFTSRYRTGSTDATLNNATWNWVATNIDTSITTFVSVGATLVPNRLEFTGIWQLSRSTFQMQAFNPAIPTGGTAAQNTSATAMDFPTATQRIQPMTLDLRYRLSPDWWLTARYQSEHFDNYDFRTTALAPATGNFIFEGNNLLPYDADLFTILITFRPGALRLPWSGI